MGEYGWAPDPRRRGFLLKLVLVEAGFLWLVDWMRAQGAQNTTRLVIGSLVVLGIVYVAHLRRTRPPAWQRDPAARVSTSRDRRGSLSGAIGWAAVFWLIGLVITPAATQWAAAADVWLASLMDNAPRLDPFTMFFVILVIVVAGIAVMALKVLAAFLVFVKKIHLAPVLGLVYGLQPDVSKVFFARAGRLLGGAARDTGISAVEVFTARRTSHRLFALAVVLAAIGVGASAYLLVSQGVARRDPSIEHVERFRPASGWRASLHNASMALNTRITVVEVDRRWVTITLRFENEGHRLFPLTVSSRTGLQRIRKRGQEGRLELETGDGQSVPATQRVVIAPRGFLEKTLAFSRPDDPFEPWMLELELVGRGRTYHGTMYFDLTRSSP